MVGLVWTRCSCATRCLRGFWPYFGDATRSSSSVALDLASTEGVGLDARLSDRLDARGAGHCGRRDHRGRPTDEGRVSPCRHVPGRAERLAGENDRSADESGAGTRGRVRAVRADRSVFRPNPRGVHRHRRAGPFRPDQHYRAGHRAGQKALDLGVGRRSGLFVRKVFHVFTNWSEFRYSNSRTASNPYENVLNPRKVSRLGLDWRFSTGQHVSCCPVPNNRPRRSRRAWPTLAPRTAMCTG